MGRWRPSLWPKTARTGRCQFNMAFETGFQGCQAAVYWESYPQPCVGHAESRFMCILVPGACSMMRETVNISKTELFQIICKLEVASLGLTKQSGGRGSDGVLGTKSWGPVHLLMCRHHGSGMGGQLIPLGVDGQPHLFRGGNKLTRWWSKVGFPNRDSSYCASTYSCLQHLHPFPMWDFAACCTARARSGTFLIFLEVLPGGEPL